MNDAKLIAINTNGGQFLGRADLIAFFLRSDETEVLSVQLRDGSVADLGTISLYDFQGILAGWQGALNYSDSPPRMPDPSDLIVMRKNDE